MTGDLHLLAGLNGAGKTTLARQLAVTLPGVRFSLDEWMLRLYGLPYDHARYPELAEDCRELIWETAAQILTADVDVILDWNMWSRARRADAVQRAGTLVAAVHLHHVKIPLDTAIARAADRVDPASHRITSDGVAHLASIFETPQHDEGFTLHVVDGRGN